LTLLEGLGLGVLQGLTEFLPVSSKGHLSLAQQILHLDVMPVPFDVMLHAGSLLAILLYFRAEIISAFTTRRRLIVPLIVGTIPTGVVYILLRYVILKQHIDVMYTNLVACGIGWLVTGTVLIAAERLAREHRSLDEVRVEDGLWIGVAQSIALMPSISRSGMTIAAGLASGFERRAAVAFSFLLGLIAISGATLIEAKEILKQAQSVGWGIMGAGFIASVVTSLAALVLLTEVVRRKRLVFFAIYCYLLGAGVLLAKLFGA